MHPFVYNWSQMSRGNRKREYIRENYRRHSDAGLSEVLRVSETEVQDALSSMGLSRSKADKAWIREHPDEPVSAFSSQAPKPTSLARLGLVDMVTALVAACAALGVYFYTLGPTITGEDSGELVTAAYHLGIAHPPGYPIWCLLGKLFTCVPHGTIAWRVNFMSAFFGAATVFLVTLLVIKLTRNRLAGVAAALALAFSGEFWEQSVIAEVYSLNAFFVAACVFFLVLWYQRRNDLILVAFAAVYGLSLCNHNTMHFLGPLFAAFVLAVDRAPFQRWKVYLGLSVLALGVAGVVHIYLPIRSMADPPVDWGNPQTWENFWEHVLRKQYKFEDTPRTPARLVNQVLTFFRLYSREFTLWLAWLPLVGLYPLWKRDKYVFGLVVLLLLQISMGFVVVLNFDMDKQSLWLNNVFWIPAYMMAAVLMGVGLDWLQHQARAYVESKGGEEKKIPYGPEAAWAVGITFAAAMVVAPLAMFYDRNDKSDYYYPYDFAHNVFKTLEPDAIYFPTADHATFPALYFQACEGMRPDVTIANKYGYPEPAVYADMPPELRTKFPTVPNEAQEAEIEDWIIANTNRPVYFTKKRPIGIPGARMVNAGLLYKAVRAGEETPERDYWAEYEWHSLDTEEARGELTAEMVLSDYHFARGRDLLEAGEKEAGLEQFDLALDIGGENKESLNNAGSAAAEGGAFEAAMDYYERAVALDPEYDLAVLNFSKLSLQIRQAGKAIPLLEHLLEVKPLHKEATDLLVDALVAVGQVDEALAKLQEVVWEVPDNPDIYRKMGFIYLNEKRDMDQAREMFRKSLELNPNQPELVALMQTPSPERPNQLPGMPELPGPPMPELPTLPNLPAGSQGPQAPMLPVP